MGFSAYNPRSVHAEIYGAPPAGGPAGMRTDAQGRPVLSVGAAQTMAASSFDLRDLSAALDTAGITAAGFDLRALEGSRDSVSSASNAFYVVSNTAALLIGGTVVLTVDTSPYAGSAFIVRADALSAATSVYLQLAPVNTPSYYVTVASASGLLLGNTYLLVPPLPMRYARVYAPGIGSVLTAYYVGQA